MSTTSRERNAYQISRRYARECVLRALFQMEFHDIEPAASLDYALTVTDDSERRLSESDLLFTNQLLAGVCERREQIDEILGSFARDWSLARIARLERSILRMAMYELVWRDEIPPAATLDEAVELTKAYCAPEATAFVNGILGNIHKHLQELKRTEQSESM